MSCSLTVDGLEQYGRRQNLEIAGTPEENGEDTNAIAIEVAKMLKVDVLPGSRRLTVNKLTGDNWF